MTPVNDAINKMNIDAIRRLTDSLGISIIFLVKISNKL
jgi:hypothetical protein